MKFKLGIFEVRSVVDLVVVDKLLFYLEEKG